MRHKIHYRLQVNYLYIYKNINDPKILTCGIPLVAFAIANIHYLFLPCVFYHLNTDLSNLYMKDLCHIF